jgi:hypothetical protein
MIASTTNMSYPDWRSAVDRRLLEIYCITIEDAGFEEEYLIKHWQSNEMPFDFVEWFGNKYDLDPVSYYVRLHSPTSQRGKLS